MMPDAELIVDRRRLKRRVTFWRVAAVVLAAVGLAALLWTPGGLDKYETHIARVQINGLITGNQETLDLFELNRKFTARWLRTLDVDTMTRAGVHSARGLITLNDVLEMYSWHVDHHLGFVPGKRASLGAAPAPAQ